MLNLPRKDFAEASISPTYGDLLYILKSRQVFELMAPSYRPKLVGVITKQRQFAAIAGMTDGIAVLGGSDSDLSEVYIDCEQFNISSHTSNRLPDLCFPRSHASSILHNECLYVFGGYTKRNEGGKGSFRMDRSIEKLIAGNWVILGVNLPIEMCRLSLASVSNRLFIAGDSYTGGILPGGVNSKSVYQLDFHTGEIVPIAKTMYSIEAGYPLEAKEMRNSISFAYRRCADTRKGEFIVEWDDWEVRKCILYARLKLKRLALI